MPNRYVNPQRMGRAQDRGRLVELVVRARFTLADGDVNGSLTPRQQQLRRLLELKEHYAAHQSPVHLELLRIGDVAALEVYLYPQVAAAPPGQQPLTPQEVIQKVVALMGRTGHVPPSRVTLRDGTTFLGVPFGLERSTGAMHVKFAVEGLEPPRVCPVEAIQMIE